MALITAKWTLVIYKEDQERTEGEKVDNFGFSLSLFAGDMELLGGWGWFIGVFHDGDLMNRVAERKKPRNNNNKPVRMI